MTDASRRPLRWIVPSVIALVVVAVAGLAFLRLRPTPPASVATAFWNDLGEGRAQQALALTTTPAPANGLLLTDDVYAKADPGIGDVRASGFRASGSTASGTVSYTVRGKRQSARVELTKVGHGPLRPSTWRITNPPLATIHATVASDGSASGLSVNGKSLPLSGDGALVIPALPGTYTFRLASSTDLLASTPQTVSVGGGTADVALNLKLTPSPALAARAVAATQGGAERMLQHAGAERELPGGRQHPLSVRSDREQRRDLPADPGAEAVFRFRDHAGRLERDRAGG